MNNWLLNIRVDLLIYRQLVDISTLVIIHVNYLFLKNFRNVNELDQLLIYRY